MLVPSAHAFQVCTGRQVSVPPRHVQPVTCIASTQHHVLTGSEDSTVNVWSLPALLELDGTAGPTTTTAAAEGDGTKAHYEPEQCLTLHRAAVTALALGPGTSADTRVCLRGSMVTPIRGLNKPPVRR